MLAEKSMTDIYNGNCAYIARPETHLVTNLRQYLKYVKTQTGSEEFLLRSVSSYIKKHKMTTFKKENQEFGDDLGVCDLNFLL